MFANLIDRRLSDINHGVFDVRNTHLEITGTSSQVFMFEVQYKVRTAGLLSQAKVSLPQSFPKTSTPSTVKIPLEYDGLIDELVINFLKWGESAQLKLKSIQLLKKPMATQQRDAPGALSVPPRCAGAPSLASLVRRG